MAAKKAHICCNVTIQPLREALQVINGKWKLPIIISIANGNARFTDIQESIPGITPKVLAKELKELEQHQLIKRSVVEDYPIKILYSTEPYAETLSPVIDALRSWGENHRKKIFGK